MSHQYDPSTLSLWSTPSVLEKDHNPIKPDPPLSLGEQEPEGWSMLRLHWREKYIKNDDDRERWLFDKYRKRRPPGCIHPHSNETRRWLREDVLRNEIKSTWTYGRWIKWFLGCCGMWFRWIPVAYERAWWVILIIYGTLWMSFCLTALQRTYGTNGDDPITWDEFVTKFANTCYATMAWTVVTLILYEFPRIYHHCCKCRTIQKKHRGYVEDEVWGIETDSILCCLETSKSRLKRSRLERSIEYECFF